MQDSPGAKQPLTELTFWALISLLNWDAAGNDAAVVAPVIEELAKRDIAEIETFEDILAGKLYALDTKAHGREIGEGSFKEGTYFSADWFLYSRCAVVADGKRIYDAVLIDPTKYPKDLEFEALLYVAGTAYEQKTGKEMDYSAPTSYETFSNAKGWR